MESQMGGKKVSQGLVVGFGPDLRRHSPIHLILCREAKVSHLDLDFALLADHVRIQEQDVVWFEVAVCHLHFVVEIIHRVEGLPHDIPRQELAQAAMDPDRLLEALAVALFHEIPEVASLRVV